MRERGSTWKWMLVVVAAVAMGVGGTYQFLWSSIRPALTANLSMNEQTLGTVFTLFVVCQTLSQFPAGWVRDRFGPRLPLLVGAVFLVVGFLGVAHAGDATQVFVAYAIGGVGAGIAYTVAVNTPVKWLRRRRGLATGVVTMAYGGVSVLFIPFVRGGVGDAFTGTLTVLAVVAGAGALIGVLVLHDPTGEIDDEVTGEDPGDGEVTGETPDGGEVTVDVDDAYGWREAIRTWQFWVLYLVMVLVNGVGLMIIGKAVAYAQQFALAAPAVTATASAVAIADSVGIVTIGAVSDRFDRTNTVAVALTISGIATGLSVWAGQAGQGVLFVAFVALVCFFRSPAFSIVPVLVREYYGAARSSENYAALYTAKVWGGVGGGVVASILIAAIGWSQAFLLGAVGLIAAGVLASTLEPVDRDVA